MAKSKKPSNAASVKTAAPLPEDMSIARKISWGALLAMVFITPIVISNVTFLGFDLPLSYDQFDIIKVFVQRVCTFIALAAWLWDILIQGGRIRRTPIDWLILAFLGWVTISAIFSIHPPTALFGKYRRFEGLFSFINYAMIYFLVLQFADRPSRLHRLADTLFWSGFVVAGYGVLQSIGRDPLQWGQLPFEANRSFSTYGNPDLLGGFLMFSVFISIALALAESNLVKRGVYWFGFLLNMWVVVAAFTRSAWVASLVGFFFIFLFAIYQRTPWKTEDWVFGGVTAVAAGSVVVRSLSNPNEVMNFGARVQSIFKFGEGSARTRFEIWQAAIDAIRARPITGFGADTFRLVFPKYKPVEYVKDAGYLSVADNVHNYPLQLAAGIGIPGVLLFYGIFAWAAIRTFPVVFSREGGPNRMVLAGFWSACAAYITHLFFGLSVTGTSFLLWVCMAAVLAPTAVMFEFKPRSWGVAVAGLASALCVIGIAYMFVYMQADNYYLKARVAAKGPDRTAFANKAVELNPYNDMYRAEVGLAQTDEYLNAINAAQQGQQVSMEQLATLFATAEKSLLDVIAFVPSEYDNYVFLTNLYTVAGQVADPKYYDKAIAIAKKGIEVEPFGPAIRLQHARALVETNRLAEAQKELEYAHQMDPAYSEAAILLSSVYDTLGQTARAIELLRTQEASYPGNQSVSDQLKRLEASATTEASPTATP